MTRRWLCARTAAALVILRAGDELRRGILAQIVHKSLGIQAETEAVFAHQIAVTGDGFKMGDRMHRHASNAE